GEGGERLLDLAGPVVRGDRDRDVHRTPDGVGGNSTGMTGSGPERFRVGGAGVFVRALTSGPPDDPEVRSKPGAVVGCNVRVRAATAGERPSSPLPGGRGSPGHVTRNPGRGLRPRPARAGGRT